MSSPKVKGKHLRAANPDAALKGDAYSLLSKRYKAMFKPKEIRAIAISSCPPIGSTFSQIMNYNAIATRHRNAVLQARQDAEKAKYYFNGEVLNRYECMERIVMLVAEGMSLPEIVEAVPGFPPVVEIRKWEERHPKFKEDMKLAEASRGELLNAERKRIVMGAKLTDDKDNVNAQILKLQASVLAEDAAFCNKKFQPKSLTQHEDITERVNRQEAYDELKRLLASNPELRDVMKDLDEVLEGEVVRDAIDDGGSGE